jgi:hypothetical protein
VNHDENWNLVDQISDPKGLWKILEEKHKVYTISDVGIISKMVSKSTYQQMHQGYNKSIIPYTKQFNFALKSYHLKGNEELNDPDIAMDVC